MKYFQIFLLALAFYLLGVIYIITYPKIFSISISNAMSHRYGNGYLCGNFTMDLVEKLKAEGYDAKMLQSFVGEHAWTIVKVDNRYIEIESIFGLPVTYVSKIVERNRYKPNFICDIENHKEKCKLIYEFEIKKGWNNVWDD